MYKLNFLSSALFLALFMNVGGAFLTPANATLPKLPSAAAQARHLPVRQAPIVHENEDGAVQASLQRAPLSEIVPSQHAQLLDRRNILRNKLEKLNDNIMKFIVMNHVLDTKLLPYHVRRDQLEVNNATLRAKGTYDTQLAALNNEFASILSFRAKGGDILNRLHALEAGVAADLKLLEAQKNKQKAEVKEE